MIKEIFAWVIIPTILGTLVGAGVVAFLLYIFD